MTEVARGPSDSYGKIIGTGLLSLALVAAWHFLVTGGEYHFSFDNNLVPTDETILTFASFIPPAVLVAAYGAMIVRKVRAG